MWEYHWSVGIFILLGIIFLLWLFFGGKEYEYVGYSPFFLELPEVSPTQETTLISVEEEPIITIYDNTIPQVPLPEKPSRWKRQEACCRAIEEIFGQPFRRDVRDLPWLLNPETGAYLELDCYNENLGLAVEHNGEQHYKFPNYFNKSKEEWLEMVRRDQLKPELCDNNGVYLITIPYTVPFTQIKSEIRKQLGNFLEVRPHEIK